MRTRYISRGFRIVEFKDLYGAECSIQESSLATDDTIWLGRNKGKHVEGDCLARMHVDKKLARWLIKKLKTFVATGDI